jgi:hypothetical protein
MTVWYVARSAGLAAWLFLMATLVWGSLTAGRLVKHKKANRWLVDMHPFLGGLALLFTAVHIGALLIDTKVTFHPLDVLIPFHASWRPLAIAWGVVGLWLLVAVQVSSWLRRKLSKRTWRGIHLTSYGMAWSLTIHAATAGTDVVNRWVSNTALVVLAVATGVSIMRFVNGPDRTAGGRSASTAGRRASGPARRPISGGIQPPFERLSDSRGSLTGDELTMDSHLPARPPSGPRGLRGHDEDRVGRRDDNDRRRHGRPAEVHQMPR